MCFAVLLLCLSGVEGGLASLKSKGAVMFDILGSNVTLWFNPRCRHGSGRMACCLLILAIDRQPLVFVGPEDGRGFARGTDWLPYTAMQTLVV